jgi:dolichol-phosphate mannosyltransferase
VRAARAQLRPGDNILVVDDNSPDGTGAIADQLAQELPGVDVLHRPGKQGLGRAYLAGFEEALAGGAELILEMDADFSHDPADLPRLLAAAEEGADLVLGSRYVAGGSVTDWDPLRKLVSRGGSWYARKILGVKVRDLTGGFKCFRRSVLEALDLSAVHADGYGFQIELTYRTIKAGFHVVEIPIVFRDRRVGESKMNARIALEAVWKVPALRRRRSANLS